MLGGPAPVPNFRCAAQLPCMGCSRWAVRLRFHQGAFPPFHQQLCIHMMLRWGLRGSALLDRGIWSTSQRQQRVWPACPRSTSQQVMFACHLADRLLPAVESIMQLHQEEVRRGSWWLPLTGNLDVHRGAAVIAALLPALEACPCRSTSAGIGGRLQAGGCQAGRDWL